MWNTAPVSARKMPENKRKLLFETAPEQEYNDFA